MAFFLKLKGYGQVSGHEVQGTLLQIRMSIYGSDI